MHKDDPELQITLQSDIHIRQFKEASKSNEPKRIEQAQMLKAIGTSSVGALKDEDKLLTTNSKMSNKP